MKVSDLTQIPDPYTRFIQSMKFLRSLKETEETAAKIRDLALLELRPDLTQQALGDAVGITSQRISQMETQARSRYGT